MTMKNCFFRNFNAIYRMYVNKVLKLKDWDFIIGTVNYLVIFIFLIYIYSMVIQPFFDGDFSWLYVHGVWYSWQAFNVGMLAFGSSIIAFNISRYHVRRQREREFIAAKAMLPQALSDLCHYTEECAVLLVEAYQNSKNTRTSDRALTTKLPDRIQSHIPVFQECIKTAEPNDANYLADILSSLQVQYVRMRQISQTRTGGTEYKRSCLYQLIKIRVLVDIAFDFARGEADSLLIEPKAHHFDAAIAMLNLGAEVKDELTEYVRKRQGF
ncbi:hypothetical protein [Vibrio mangrovi]|uniref:Uncharacterized protein n=1 Tax=Vibrio mangrovi TaxID=474394 RepID=A0A1Y6IWW2_9VIBR|nr:hypothetical protein [Vibrio mangrovi]MDW6005441.1 hypothetical protein [Vibrio mangrovi]SMS02118.1 hypothetical protein VIM7927_03433 [Vibrio mangrovi]